MMKKVLATLLALALVLSLSVTALAAGFPDKNMTLIVPWNAGGSSDLIGRLLCAEMEQTLGVTISVVNTPGATGTVGMNDCMLAPHDGYTMIANATPYSHGIMGLADWKPADWDFLAAFYVPGIIAVSKNSPYKTFQELYDAMQTKDVTCGTAGVGSSGYTNMSLLSAADAGMGNFKHIAYSGGAAAITAVISGEVDFTPQLSNEMIDYLRSGDMIALAALTAEDLQLDGVSYAIPSIKTFLADTEKVLPCGDAFGLMFPSDVPDENAAVIEAAYLKAAQSDTAKNFASQKGVMLLGDDLAASNALKDQTAQKVGWILYDTGVAVNSPADYGYPKAE